MFSPEENLFLFHFKSLLLYSPFAPYFFLLSSTCLGERPLSASTPKYETHSSEVFINPSSMIGAVLFRSVQWLTGLSQTQLWVDLKVDKINKIMNKVNKFRFDRKNLIINVLLTFLSGTNMGNTFLFQFVIFLQFRRLQSLWIYLDNALRQCHS